MPLHSELNRPNKAGQNPFEEPPQRISEFTATEIATLQSRLDKQLGPEYISTRPGAGGGKVHYLAAEKVINLANEVFGFNGWSSAIQQVQVDFVEESSSQKVSLGLSVIVRVTLRDGTYHEDVGYGHIENCKGKAAAFEKAKKEGATDALKRALRNFGNILGNCLYDKDYLSKVTKLKMGPTRWDADNLHRHPDYAPIKKTSIADGSSTTVSKPVRTDTNQSIASNITHGSTEFGDDEFGGNLFDEVDFSHPDEVRLDETMVDNDGVPQGQNGVNGHQTPKRVFDAQRNGLQGRPQPSAQNQQPQVNGAQSGQRPQVPASRPGGQVGAIRQSESNTSIQRPPTPPLQNTSVLPPPPGGPLPGFVTGRSADKPVAQPFNPHAEAQSIRRTAGVNSGKSEPILRSTLNGQTAGNAWTESPGARPGTSAGLGGPRPNFVNPAADMHRRVGMPVAPQSPMGNRGAYKPPSAVKRPAPNEVTGRPPLADTTNMNPAEPGPDAKKPKIEPGQPAQTENLAKT